ncbi:MAG TPA: PAS domain S-box protein, partial [Trueperaceae bacterium]|nr:PAS domain S-box protein [Trueperaceae bacterium]
MRNWRVPVTFTLSLDGVVTSWSESVRTVLGYGPNDFLGKQFEILFTEDDVFNGVPERLQRTAMEEGSAPLAGWRLDKDGEHRFARGELTALHGADSEIFGLSVVFLPTTAGPRREVDRGAPKPIRAVEQLQPDRLSEMLTGLDERFYILDDDFNFVYVNRVAEQAWGMAHEDLVGQGFLEVFPQLQDTLLLGEHLKVANEGSTSRFETNSPLTGNKVEVSIYSNLTGGISVLIRDPFERNEQFNSMLGDDRLAEAYAALEIAVLEWGPQSGAWQESLTTTDIFGLAPQGRLGDRHGQLALIVPTDVDRYQRTVERAIERGESWRVTYRIVRPRDGEIAWLEEHGSLNAAEGPKTYSLHAWDVTATKLAEERMRSSQRRLQQELASNRRLQEVMSRTAKADDPTVALG